MAGLAPDVLATIIREVAEQLDRRATGPLSEIIDIALTPFTNIIRNLIDFVIDWCEKKGLLRLKEQACAALAAILLTKMINQGRPDIPINQNRSQIPLTRAALLGLQ